ncbi:Acetyl xylan esterase (AXE1) [Rosistilla ulvae]|uniref:Acetyl xylan esterase (AXE1) n=1 Tax=Rosistilla ulvae TaxID=1930277 RepID=A0A517LW98_9BACT|nr:Acetyl xylan esterase (AXE1) [Rosistilla ulvae]
MEPRRVAACLFALSLMVVSHQVVGQSATPELTTLDSHFPMQVPASKQAIEAQNEHVRTMLRLANGLIPMPELADPQPTIYGRREMDGYSIEKIYFESLPGFYVTGNLYRPEGATDAAPIVLSAHGHWTDGRFYDAGDKAARAAIAMGAERFESAAHNVIQARCVQFARMGCVVLNWDMVGHADSQQISIDRIHGFRTQAAEIENTADGWLLFSPQAESHLQSPMGLQTINTLQAVRVAQMLPGVDASRIAMTGASGGGTQTFVAAAIQPAITAAFPAVMVSTGMQGGCTCENACYLRIDGGNIHIASCIAPRWLGMTAADDWTRTMPTDGFPELQRVYELFGAKNRVSLAPAIHFRHNYNHVSRVACYAMLNKAFGLGLQEPILESDFQRLTAEELTVWDAEHPAPPAGLDFERKLLKAWHESTQRKLQLTLAVAEDKGAEFRDVAGPAVEAMVGYRPDEAAAKAEFDLASKQEINGSLVMTGDLTSAGDADKLPVYFNYPDQWNGNVTLVADVGGIAAVEKRLADPESEYAKLLASGTCIATCDLPAAEGDDEGTKQKLVRQDRLAACFTYGYNRALLLRRAKSLLTLAQFMRNHDRTPKQIQMDGLGEAGPIVAVAGAVAGPLVDGCRINRGDFRFQDVANIADANFVPGGARYLDLPGILALHAPRPLEVHGGAKGTFDATEAQYKKMGALGSLKFAVPKSADGQ